MVFGPVGAITSVCLVLAPPACPAHIGCVLLLLLSTKAEAEEGNKCSRGWQWSGCVYLPCEMPVCTRVSTGLCDTERKKGLAGC